MAYTRAAFKKKIEDLRLKFAQEFPELDEQLREQIISTSCQVLIDSEDLPNVVGGRLGRSVLRSGRDESAEVDEEAPTTTFRRPPPGDEEGGGEAG